MTDISTINSYGEELEHSMAFQSAPLAVRMLASEDEIPDDAIRPKKDRGQHIAQCQAFALSRRNRETIAMLKEDNWCPGPVASFGLVQQQEIQRGPQPGPAFEFGKYVGILSAPLRTASFVPDAVIIYCDTNQLRVMLLSTRPEERSLIKSNFFPASCTNSVIPVILNQEYWVNLPDPGEYVRALTTAGEMILSIPWPKMETFMNNLRKFNRNESGYEREQMMIKNDYPLPPFYRDIFIRWGMDHD
ncbi:MAG: DUF169 domain-containing protein [Dehalococcoidales bacterium]|nr:DUF169 domain-containing protein [Dehalococcoidales bacterium]